jgi:hypothetical protein
VVAPPSSVTFAGGSVFGQIDDYARNGFGHMASNTCTLRAAVTEAAKTSGAAAFRVGPTVGAGGGAGRSGI